MNPFPINNYISEYYFCDRENELKILLRNAQNGINTTLISPRRLGKTGLILRFLEELSKEKEIESVYFDIDSTRSLGDFVHLFAGSILKKFPAKTSIGKQFMRLIKGFRPSITFDAITGTPQIQFAYQSSQDTEYTLSGLLQFLENQPIEIVVAIDEFQQIAKYPEKNIESLLRTYIQQLKRVHFIFSGSKRHILVEMFSSASRPFFSSTQFLMLKPIASESYTAFIHNHFEQGKRNISDESIGFILDWTKSFTFYTQSVCNRLYATKQKNITLDFVKSECANLLKENQDIYFQYRGLLTSKQWDFMIALAKEDSVSQLFSKDFLSKQGIGTPSNVRRMIDSLLEKEMVLELVNINGTTYQVYDVFLTRWLQTTY